MGFFASRWIEKHGGETEKAALSTPPAAPVPKTKWYSRKKDTDNEHGGPGSISKSHRPATIGDSRSIRESASTRNPVNYATWGSSSKSAIIVASQNDLNTGYSTIRRSKVSSKGSANSTSRPATDSVTVTLAQKLDELATANADGLLSDDEYRMLRQNLFERFGSVAAQIPAEQPLISLPSPSTRQALNSHSERQLAASSLPQGDSNFNVSRSRSTRSVRSTASRGSSVQTAITSLIRRATRRESPRTSFGGSGNDGESTYSRGSRNSSIFPRGGLPRTLIHKASAGSMQTTPSIIGGTSGGGGHAYDVRSISSRRTNKSGVDNATIISRATSRSRPPSSYHRRRAPSEAGASDELGSDWTAAELRSEIQSLEEENKRLLDMFNGLEMTTLMKHRPAASGRTTSDSMSGGFGGDGRRNNISSDWTLLPDAKKIPSQEKSSSRLSISSSSMRSFAGLQRKGSLNFLSKRSQLPPLPPIPTSATSASTFASMPTSATSMIMSPTSSSTSSSLHPHPLAGGSQSNRSSPNLSMDRGTGSTSTGKLTRSRSGYIGTNHGRGEGAGRDDVNDPQQSALENGMDDIRSKRASVVLRYEKRLEYLRARLRSAELHERLLKIPLVQPLMRPALRPTPTVPETAWDYKRGHPAFDRRQDPPSVTQYPECYNVTPDTQTCYPTSDTVIYQNQWSRVIWNIRYSLFIGDNGDGNVTLILKNAETDKQVGNWTQPNKLGEYSLAVDDRWWDERAVSLWRGQDRNWTFYWQIIPSTHTIDGGEAHQPTFVVVQTALPNSALSSSSGSIISQSLASVSRSIASADSSSAQAAQSSRDAALQAGRDNNFFPPWAIALIVVLGVISIVSILTLFFVLLRGARRQRSLDRRISMGSESPMIQAPGAPLSPAAASTSVGHGGIVAIPPPVRNAPSIRYNDDSINSRANSGSANPEGVITGSDAAIMADAFRKALRKPEFNAEGDSPETQGTGETEALLLNRELAEEGQNIRSVSSERGVKVVADNESPKA